MAARKLGEPLFELFGEFRPDHLLCLSRSRDPPTNARSWEAGVKLEFFDGRLRATADYYDLTKTNIATTDIAHPGLSRVTGEARSKGVELDIRGEMLPGWSVIASYANQDVRTHQEQ